MKHFTSRLLYGEIVTPTFKSGKNLKVFFKLKNPPFCQNFCIVFFLRTFKADSSNLL